MQIPTIMDWLSLLWQYAICDGSAQHARWRSLPRPSSRWACDAIRHGTKRRVQRCGRVWLQALPDRLRAIVPKVEAHVVQIGARIGKGEALAVVQPDTLQQAVDVLQACVDADVCVIPQGANTGLTGGSVPRPSDPCVGGLG